MKLPYREGTWFAVPLRDGGFAVGVVARATAKGKVILCYFFGPRRASVPKLTEVESLQRSNAVRAWRVGDLSLVEGDWPIIGQSESWRRSDWPMPVFIRRDPLRPKAWRVYYSDDDPSKLAGEEPESVERRDIEENGLFGAAAAEIRLTSILAQKQNG